MAAAVGAGERGGYSGGAGAGYGAGVGCWDCVACCSQHRTQEKVKCLTLERMGKENIMQRDLAGNESEYGAN